jgi:hypothetical protein
METPPGQIVSDRMPSFKNYFVKMVLARRLPDGFLKVLSGSENLSEVPQVVDLARLIFDLFGVPKTNALGSEWFATSEPLSHLMIASVARAASDQKSSNGQQVWLR